MAISTISARTDSAVKGETEVLLLGFGSTFRLMNRLRA